MRSLFVVLILFVLGTQVRAERIVFEMSMLGYTFGEMVLTKTVVNDSVVVYTLRSKGESNAFWMNRKGESFLDVEYRNGKLYASEYRYLNHGELEKWTRTKVDGTSYVSTTSEGEMVFVESPRYSLIKLYFEPHLDGDSIFCEEDGSYATIEHNAGKGIFNVRCQDGSRSTYHVKDGVVEMMEIHLGMANVKLKRVS